MSLLSRNPPPLAPPPTVAKYLEVWGGGVGGIRCLIETFLLKKYIYFLVIRNTTKLIIEYNALQ